MGKDELAEDSDDDSDSDIDDSIFRQYLMNAGLDPANLDHVNRDRLFVSLYVSLPSRLGHVPPDRSLI